MGLQKDQFLVTVDNSAGDACGTGCELSKVTCCRKETVLWEMLLDDAVAQVAVSRSVSVEVQCTPCRFDSDTYLVVVKNELGVG